jgi:hypothetical protein
MNTFWNMGKGALKVNIRKWRLITEVLCVFFAILLVGCNVSSEIVDDAEALAKTFVAEAGYSIDYPSDWTVSANEEETYIEFSGSDVLELGGVAETLTITKSEAVTDNLFIIYDPFISGLESAGVNEIVTSDVTINEQTAVRVEYKLNNNTQKGIAIFSVVADIKYKITYLGLLVYYSESTIESVIDSFEFQ